MPREVVESAEKTLRDLERRQKHAEAMSMEDDGSVQLSFFQLDDPTLSAIKDKLEAADLNNMTPLQAFDLLRSLKGELGL
jgi:DNA mismatch repair protein MutS